VYMLYWSHIMEQFLSFQDFSCQACTLGTMLDSQWSVTGTGVHLRIELDGCVEVDDEYDRQVSLRP